MSDKVRGSDDTLGDLPGFQEWNDEVMSKLQARQESADAESDARAARERDTIGAPTPTSDAELSGATPRRSRWWFFR